MDKVQKLSDSAVVVLSQVILFTGLERWKKRRESEVKMQMELGKE
jgi:hypothetical protein